MWFPLLSGDYKTGTKRKRGKGQVPRSRFGLIADRRAILQTGAKRYFASPA
jgi:hypothetical protein